MLKILLTQQMNAISFLRMGFFTVAFVVVRLSAIKYNLIHFPLTDIQPFSGSFATSFTKVNTEYTMCIICHFTTLYLALSFTAFSSFSLHLMCVDVDSFVYRHRMLKIHT